MCGSIKHKLLTFIHLYPIWPNSHNGALFSIDLIRLKLACFLYVYLDVEFKALVSHLLSSYVKGKKVWHK